MFTKDGNKSYTMLCVKSYEDFYGSICYHYDSGIADIFISDGETDYFAQRIPFNSDVDSAIYAVGLLAYFASCSIFDIYLEDDTTWEQFDMEDLINTFIKE